LPSEILAAAALPRNTSVLEEYLRGKSCIDRPRRIKPEAPLPCSGDVKNFVAWRQCAFFNVVVLTERRYPLATTISSSVGILLVLGGLLLASCDRPAATDSTAPSASTSPNDASFAGVVFRADPNPVPPGDPKGRTTIIWDTGSDAVGEVYVISSGNEKLFASGHQGSQDAPWIQPGPNEFRLYTQGDHKLIAQLTVTMPASSTRP